MRWLGILVALLLIGACFLPWVTIQSNGIEVSGFDAKGTNFGKPGLFHFVIASFYIALLLINRVWSNRVAFFICALNIAWAVRNFVVITACRGGECPEKHAGIYIVILAAVSIMICALFIDVRWRGNRLTRS
jgi:hypothetical protein